MVPESLKFNHWLSESNMFFVIYVEHRWGVYLVSWDISATEPGCSKETKLVFQPSIFREGYLVAQNHPSLALKWCVDMYTRLAFVFSGVLYATHHPFYQNQNKTKKKQ